MNCCCGTDYAIKTLMPHTCLFSSYNVHKYKQTLHIRCFFSIQKDIWLCDVVKCLLITLLHVLCLVFILYTYFWGFSKINFCTCWNFYSTDTKYKDRHMKILIYYANNNKVLKDIVQQSDRLNLIKLKKKIG